MKGGFGKAYNDFGVDNYYQQQGHHYSNPHKYDIERLLKKKFVPAHNSFSLNTSHRILDLACGSGEVSTPLQQLGYGNILGVDPYTSTRYREVTGLECRTFTFL